MDCFGKLFSSTIKIIIFTNCKKKLITRQFLRVLGIMYSEKCISIPTLQKQHLQYHCIAMYLYVFPPYVQHNFILIVQLCQHQFAFACFLCCLDQNEKEVEHLKEELEAAKLEQQDQVEMAIQARVRPLSFSQMCLTFLSNILGLSGLRNHHNPKTQYSLDSY